MFCKQCGFNNDEYSRLCKRCGSHLREADDLYDEDTNNEQDTEPSGGLKYAVKRESLLERIKSPFKRLGRVDNQKKRNTALIISAVLVVVCVCSLAGSAWYRSCHATGVSVYGNDTGNIAHNAIAVADSQWIFYSRLYGDNPGLYRVSLSGGDELKLSYHLLTGLSCTDDWVYGIDGDGALMRISKDGLTTQMVINEPVAYPNIVSDVVYYLDSDGYICRAQAVEIDGDVYYEPELLGGAKASSLYAYNDWLYYTTIEGTVKPSGSIEVDYGDGYTGGGDEGAVISDSLGTQTSTEQEIIPTVSQSGYAVGHIRRMRFDATQDAELYDGLAYNITVRGDYVYFYTEVRTTVSATDIDPLAPADLTADIIAAQTWRLYIETCDCAKFLEVDTAQSPLNVDIGGIFYINTQGDLEKTSTTGQNRTLLLTGSQEVESVATAGDWVYYTAAVESGRVIGRVRSDGTNAQMLCELPAQVTIAAED